MSFCATKKNIVLMNFILPIHDAGIMLHRFDACKVICGKRNPPKTSAGTGQFQRNPKHTNILHEKCGINYDKPLHPMQVVVLLMFGFKFLLEQ